MNTPTTDLAAIIAEAKKVNDNGETCFCPDLIGDQDCDLYKPCPSITALISAASLALAPAPGGEVAEKIILLKAIANGIDLRGSVVSDWLIKAAHLLTTLDQRRRKAEQSLSLARNDLAYMNHINKWHCMTGHPHIEFITADNGKDCPLCAAESTAAALREQLAEAIELILSDKDYGAGSMKAVDILQAVLSSTAPKGERNGS